jgi:hypothetical protein
LLIALCYVFLNPVSARLAGKPEDYKWSTYAATAGLAPVPGYISIEWLTTLFPADSIPQSQQRFRSLMGEARPVMAYLKSNETDIDVEGTRRVIRSYVGGQVQLATLPQTYRSALRSQLSELMDAGLTEPSRSAAVYEAHVVHGYKLAEIARQLLLHPGTVSKIFRSVCASRPSSAA